MGELLAIYLNDHLAGATAGVELARRLRGSNRNDPEFGPALAEVCAEIEADRETLKEVMDQLGVGKSKLKPLAAILGERLGRLKLNGQLRGYSPLSRLDELGCCSSASPASVGCGGRSSTLTPTIFRASSSAPWPNERPGS